MVSTSPLRLASVAAGSAVTSSAAFCRARGRGAQGHAWMHERYAVTAAHELHVGSKPVPLPARWDTTRRAQESRRREVEAGSAQ